MPDPSPEQPPSWPPTSEPAARPTNPPRITARGVGHLPSAAPEDEPVSDPLQPAAPGPGVYGEPQQAAGSYGLDPEARRNEWEADLGAPEVPQQAAPQYSAPQAPGPHESAPQQGGDWGESPDWPPKSSQDWMAQQSQTGWGLAAGSAPWPDQGPAPQAPPPAPETTGEQAHHPDQGAAAYGAPASGPAFNAPPQQDGGHEFPELRADPYEADVYGHAQYRGDAGGQDLYQSDPYQAERLQAEAQQAREQYAAAQQPPAPFGPPQQQAGYAEPSYDEQRYQAEAPPAPPSSYSDQSYGERPRQEQSAEAAVPEAVPAQRHEAPEAPAEPAPAPVRTSPPTHRGVRYAIYGIGGLITLGLIIGIVIMLGAAPPSEPTQEGESTDEGTSEDSGDDGALDAERYSALAAAAGSAEWFSWRYGDAGGGSGAEEVPAVSGDVLATEPLLGDADQSVQGQLGYLADDAGLTGIDHITAVESTDALIGLAPRAGGRFSEDGPEPELKEGATADCLAGLGDLGRPVALARPEQSGEVSAHSVIVFSSGIVATTGISGAQGGTCLQLPDGQVPTDVALTDGNELALVTTWNPASQTGALVVLAMGDKSGSYQSSWSESYPGLPNAGHFASAVIAGTVALPFTAPTSVDAWSNSGGSLDLGRATVEGGAHRDTVASAGYAIVGDMSASQVAVVDLASTLGGLAAQHYDGAEFAFDATAGEAVGFEGGVADVAATEGAAAVATGDGVVHELDGELKETAATQVGANPTCLVVGAQSGAFIATSRGDATISWVSGGEVSKELADSRLTDPVCASETPAMDVKGYAGNAAVVLVSDFEGRKLHAYLDGEATIPGGATVGGEGFSYGGAYEVAGNPWGASVTVDVE